MGTQRVRVEVEGLDELRATLRKMDSESNIEQVLAPAHRDVGGWVEPADLSEIWSDDSRRW
jgi:hypothetical protein